MTSHLPRLEDMLGPEAQVLLEGGRPGLQKRIIAINGVKYVLQHFRTKRGAIDFENTIDRLHRAGISVQTICTGTRTWRETLRYGHWLAFAYLPGNILAEDAEDAALAALGATMARLNTLEGTPYRALFDRTHPRLPHASYASRQARVLTPAQNRWIEESFIRLRALPGTQLTHGDLYAKNILKSPDGAISLIDYEMLAYDLSGIELAATLLRPFCRQRRQRQALLTAYLAASPPRLKAIWEEHGADLLFAAAARLALGRKDKLQRTWRRDRIVAFRQALAPPSMRETLAQKRAAYARVIHDTEKRYSRYLHVSHRLATVAATDPDIDPISLIERCEADLP